MQQNPHNYVFDELSDDKQRRITKNRNAPACHGFHRSQSRRQRCQPIGTIVRSLSLAARFFAVDLSAAASATVRLDVATIDISTCGQRQTPDPINRARC